MGTKSKSQEQTENRTGFFHDERVWFISGMFACLFSIYLSLALISFIFTWQTDQSFEWQNVFSASSVSVDNWGGKIGAFFANMLISDGFGIGAFVIPLILGLGGLRLMKLRPYPFRKASRTLLITAILTSLTLGYLFGSAQGLFGNGLGGAHGVFMAQWMNSLMGKFGTGLFLFFAAATFLTFTTKNTFHWLNFGVGAVHTMLKKDETATKTAEEAEWEANGNEDGKPNTISKIQEIETPTTPKTNIKRPAEVIFETNIDKTEKSNIISPDEEVGNNITDASVIEAAIMPNDHQADENTNDEFVDNSGEIQLTVEKIAEEDQVEIAHSDQDFYDPTLDLSGYQRPPVELLEEWKNPELTVSNDELISNKNKIVETLANYKIQIDKIKATIGPTVTLYEIVPAPGVRISKIKNLEDDIALSLAALGIRIIAPIPGKGTIGIEVPNLNPEVVSMLSIIKSAKFQESKYDLPLALGKTISNETFMLDLTKMPHLLVAGATGQGKSVGLNAMLASLLYKKHPSQLKFVLVDPKKVELTLYSKIERHFLAKLPDSEEPIITDTQKVIYTLNSLCNEMDSRYDLLKLAHVRNIKEYNEKFVSRRLSPTKGHKFLPYIVVVIDEFADLIMTAGREIETPIARIAQLARAIGIHLIIATQRPTTNIITGVIKANFPARIAFRVSSMIDSRTILDCPGANQLIGRGDMLVSTGNDIIRVQCAFVDTPEIERITDFIGNQRGYSSAFLLPEYKGDETIEGNEVDLSKKDDLFEEAARVIVMNQQGSTSMIQRKFSIGYNRAGRIIDQLEAAGIVGSFEGSKARQVLITDEISLEHILNNLNNK
ncbi:FtsK/SpoIIIE family DNA translocase [Williamwhitmania taraxaci]|uniref:DNA segregation ATPase FtsK/SpoIIIE, S-DNA-T family n=1 Tax=Williamwhitmania taraxaci TaxID=1640674 RepID=A0A1G6HIU5_9BACT|nr:DNA translocase FtsK [Williamwhitmania taraxaci]SDB93366.1 DNA segregation ATPase FtsK/SpoIIIE, S-DNA-T family [Williamwhitmania taraxaci]